MCILKIKIMMIIIKCNVMMTTGFLNHRMKNLSVPTNLYYYVFMSLKISVIKKLSS